MKKIILSLIFALAFPAVASAKSGAYVGVNANHSNARHKVAVISNDDAGTFNFNLVYPNIETSEKNIGFGFDLGYKFSSNSVFIAPELFFDQLNNSAQDPLAADYGDYSVYKADRIVLNYRYGAKLNLGVNLTSKLAGFISGGVANVDYDNEWQSFPARNYNGAKLAGIYGVGISYDLTDSITAKASYDWQKFAIRYGFEGWRSSVDLRVAKVGIAYNF